MSRSPVGTRPGLPDMPSGWAVWAGGSRLTTGLVRRDFWRRGVRPNTLAASIRARPVDGAPNRTSDVAGARCRCGGCPVEASGRGGERREHGAVAGGAMVGRSEGLAREMRLSRRSCGGWGLDLVAFGGLADLAAAQCVLAGTRMRRC